MIKLIDFSQIVIANAHVNTSQNNGKLEINLLRHQVLNSIRAINVALPYYNCPMAVCADSNTYWRQNYFPYYKANRKKSSFPNWSEIEAGRDLLYNEFKEHLPYPVLKVPMAEADDIIGVLARKYSLETSVLIVSADQDFYQLHSERVSQMHPITKVVTSNYNPNRYLREHILKGDVGDGIPNVLSDDDTFVNPKKRQKPLRQKQLHEWLNGSFPIDEQTLRNYNRNKTLIDLNSTPIELQDKIMKEYLLTPFDRTKFYNYLKANSLNQLLSQIGDF